MSPSLFPSTPDKGGKSREIIGVGDYFLVKKNTFVIASPKPHLVLGKILAYNCNGEMGELVFYTQVGKTTLPKHLKNISGTISILCTYSIYVLFFLLTTTLQL
jgi:hypothetical protein